MKWRAAWVVLIVAAAAASVSTSSEPVRATHGMVVSQEATASKIGVDVLRAGGTAVDAAVATAFALAVVYPTAGNIGGGGFIVFRPATGDPVAYDFREMAPAAATPTMFLTDGKYDAGQASRQLPVGGRARHRRRPPPRVEGATGSCRGSGWSSRPSRWPGTGSRSASPWPRRSPGCCRRWRGTRPSVAQFSKHGVPYGPGEMFVQPDLARTLTRIAEHGPAGFYEGETARLIEQDMASHGGLITRADLKAYTPERRTPLRGTYRGRGDHLDAADQLRRDGAHPDAQRARRLRPRRERLGIGGEHAPHGRSHAAGVRRPRAPSRRPRVQPVDADRAR